MDDIAEGARRVLNHIENNGTEDRYVTGYIRAVRQYAINAQRGDGQGMAKVLEALTKINLDTDRLNQRIDTIEKTTSALSTTLSTPAANSAAAWRTFRAREWQRDLAKAVAPNTRSNGTSSPGVPEIELREDREIIVKVGSNRDQIRGLTPKDLVERAERQRSTIARQKNSGVLAGQASFVAARKLPSGDVVMIANSAAGAEVLRKHRAWLRAFGPGSVIQEPSWGVVAYHIPVKSMKLTPETMANVAAELLRQNNWGEGARIQYLGWLTRPGERAEGSILIEFTSPVMANRAIVTGVVWGKQIHNVSRFCREGRMKLCRKCQKPGHIQSHCSNVFKCGHCAGGHPTWECPSTKGQAIPVKCANCGEGHRPTSRECPVKIAAVNEAKQALVECPTYHRIPLHFRARTSSDKETTSTESSITRPEGMEASVHAPESQEEDLSTNCPATVIDLDETPAADETTMEPIEAAQSRRGPGRPKGSRTRAKAPKPPVIPLACQRSTRFQLASQKATQEEVNSKRRRTVEPEDVMDEQPDDSDWFNIQLNPADFPQTNSRQDNQEHRLSQFITEVTTVNDPGSTPEPVDEELDPESPEYRKLVVLKYRQRQVVPIESSPPVSGTDASTIEDTNDEVWHETSERSDDEQHQL
ncbi:zinc knuckle domain protein [Penicillium nucicola]|uniref:zinc knuckle domain protein n=1 Tax=Penicillium nucicola TaxID=1850975 RepID=UPI0025450B23|nr:zinc knuckle domain protein [Penicillium nucicola]KAJ5742632.1 zinc knuckle domain protein [Penicillium nucicola]